jgi:protein-tyrosine-phosphatase
MAEALFRRLASERIGCTADKLLSNNLDVLSAGVAAADSSPASLESIQALKERGINLAEHLSQRVTDEMLVKSDLILAMTPTHLGILQNARPDLASRMRLLRPDGGGISDPIGCGIEEYRRCADEIAGCLKLILDDCIQKDTE